MPLRDDATRQLRVPIAAAACQCDEDWHSGKLSLKIPLFPFPINQTIWAARKNAPGRGARTQTGLRRVFSEGKEKRRSSGKNKKNCIQGRGGKKICRRFGGRGGLWKSKGRERETRPDSSIVSVEGRGWRGQLSPPD